MKHRLRLGDLALTTKIVLLVVLMGAITLGTTAYTLTSMHGMDRQYRTLIAQKAQGALRMGDAARHLGEASRLAYAVLTEREEDGMRDALGELATLQSQFNGELRTLGMLLPGKAPELQAIAQQSEQVFALARRIIGAAVRWRGDQALQLIDSQFAPALALLRQDMDALRSNAVAEFEAASAQLHHATQRTTVFTAVAVLLGLVLAIALALYVAITQISRPIAQLTRSMALLTDRQYGDSTVLALRRDEVGSMARALQVFKASMLRADRLAIEVAASAEARRLSEQLVDLVDAIPGAVFQMHVRPDGWRTTLFLSDKAAQLHSRPIEELRALQGLAGHGFLRASRACKEQAHQAFMHALHTLQPLDLDTLSEQGERPRWLKTLATARRTPDGGALFNGVWLDITEQKQQAQALAQAKEVAEHVAHEKATFLATMSHEIRTPLNAILGMTQIALQESLPPAQRERLEKTLRAGKHLLGIVNDVLDFSKIEAGQMALESTDFALAQLLADVQELYCERASAKGLHLSVRVDPAVPARLRGDPHRIAQILINYLNNAIKFTDAGTVAVHVQLAQADAQGLVLRCTVQDTGMGIPQAQQAQLFQAFQQADTSITRRFGGTGLGLAISRQLAGLMGGAVGVCSAPHQGSAFWFTARVQRAMAPASALQPERCLHPTAEKNPAHRLQGLRILLVDDNALNLAVACGLLESGGVRVDTAGDGAQALAALQAAPDGHYAGVLMDMQMPVLDGLAATQALRQQPRFATLPIVAMTANATHQDIARTRAAGMNAHLSKPILEDMLWRTLHSALDTGAPSDSVEGLAEVDSAARPIDLQVLRELRQALPAERLRALAAAFEQDCRHRVGAIAKAAGQHPPDWAGLHTHSHHLSGSAGSLGLQQLGERAHALHRAVRQRDLAGLQPLVQALQHCMEHSLPPLRAWCSQAEDPQASL